MDTKLNFEVVDIEKSPRFSNHGPITLITFMTFISNGVQHIAISKYEAGWEKRVPYTSTPIEDKIIKGATLDDLLNSLSSNWIIRRYPHGASAFFKELHPVTSGKQLEEVTKQYEKMKNYAAFRNYPDFDPRYDKIFNRSYCREED